MAIRASLGAGRWRLIRQLLLESLLLALAGRWRVPGGVWRHQGLVAAIPENTIPDEAVIGLNVPVLLFSLSIAVFIRFCFSAFAPALHLPSPILSSR